MSGPTAAGPPRAPRTPKSPPEGARSEQVETLRAQLARGNAAAALARFWQEVERTGAPLVEELEGDPWHRAVTFLWRDRHGDQPGTRRVVLMANKLTDPSVWEHSLLERIEGTDVWLRTYRLRSDWRASYQLAADDGESSRAAGGLVPGARGRWHGLANKATPDPLNRSRLEGRDGAAASSVVELPDAPQQLWWRRRTAVPRGTVEERYLESAILDFARRVWVYTPARFDPGHGPHPVLVLLDGEDWVRRLSAVATLDNLIADGHLEPVVAVMVDALDGETRRRELSCHEPFVRFLGEELLPWAADQYGASIEAARTTIVGHSLGGLTAAFAALRAPTRFGNVLAQSASLWWPGDPEPDLPGDWLMHQFATAPPAPVRFHLRVGLQEWVLAPLHRHLRDVLIARGCPVTYHEYYGGHDVACWRGGLADGLIALADVGRPCDGGRGR